jgi:diketogulonate reductase-like aldo/keto reductase
LAGLKLPKLNQDKSGDESSVEKKRTPVNSLLLQPKKTLSDLGLQYVDLYLIHWPLGYKVSNIVGSKNYVLKWFINKRVIDNSMMEEFDTDNL